jgi:hypothetical protein
MYGVEWKGHDRLGSTRLTVGRLNRPPEALVVALEDLRIASSWPTNWFEAGQVEDKGTPAGRGGQRREHTGHCTDGCGGMKYIHFVCLHDQDEDAALLRAKEQSLRASTQQHAGRRNSGRGSGSGGRRGTMGHRVGVGAGGEEWRGEASSAVNGHRPSSMRAPKNVQRSAAPARVGVEG